MDPVRQRLLSTASDLVRLPVLNQARVHKCFLALANRKIITKDASVCVHPRCCSTLVIFLIASVGTLSLAGPLIPLSPSTFLMIAALHHIPPSGTIAELIKCNHGKLIPHLFRNGTVRSYLPNTWSLTTTNLILTFPSLHFTLFISHFHTPSSSSASVERLAGRVRFLALIHLVPGL